MSYSFTNSGAFLGNTGNISLNDSIGTRMSHHLTMTGDPAGGIMKAHDTFQIGARKINISGPHYNNLNSFGNDFNPGPQACNAFRSLFGQ